MSKRYMGSIQAIGLDGLNSPVTTVEYLVVSGGGNGGAGGGGVLGGGGGKGASHRCYSHA